MLSAAYSRPYEKHVKVAFKDVNMCAGRIADLAEGQSKVIFGCIPESSCDARDVQQRLLGIDHPEHRYGRSPARALALCGLHSGNQHQNIACCLLALTIDRTDLRDDQDTAICKRNQRVMDPTNGHVEEEVTPGKTHLCTRTRHHDNDF